MTEIFLKLVNMSLAAGWLVLAVLVLRILLRKAPKWLNPVLWGIVGLRLILPFSIESVLSLIPSAETVSPEIMYEKQPAVTSGIPVVNDVVNPVIQNTFAPQAGDSVNPLQIWIPIASAVWLSGVTAMLLYAAVSYLRLAKRVRTAVLLKNNVYQSENVDSPFVLGILRPRIFLPFRIEEQDMEYVLAHEQAHIRRRDHWYKPVGFLLLSCYWFHPLIWAAYILLCRDIELACDERVVRDFTPEKRADYSQALLSCSVSRKMISACPIAFGEVGLKERVQRVLHYKKPALWLTVVAVAVCAMVAVCFLTDPSKADREDGEFEKAADRMQQAVIGAGQNVSTGQGAEKDNEADGRGNDGLTQDGNGGAESGGAAAETAQGGESAGQGADQSEPVELVSKVRVEITPEVLTTTYTFREPMEFLTKEQKELMANLPVGELPRRAARLREWENLTDERFIWENTLVALASDEEADVTLYGVVSSADLPPEGSWAWHMLQEMSRDGIVIRHGDKAVYYPLEWEANGFYGWPPQLVVDDFDGDGEKEAAVDLYWGRGVGTAMHCLYFFELDTLDYTVPDYSNLDITVSYEPDTRRAVLNSGGVEAEVTVPEVSWADFGGVTCGDYMTFEYREGGMLCRLSLDFSGRGDWYLMDAVVPIVWRDGKYQLGEVESLEVLV